MADAPAPRGKGAGGFLTQKFGPLPVWAYLGIGGVGLFVLAKMGILGGGGSSQAGAGLVTVTTPQGQQIQVPASQAAQYLNQGVPSGFVPASSVGSTSPGGAAGSIKNAIAEIIDPCTRSDPTGWYKSWCGKHGDVVPLGKENGGSLVTAGSIPGGTQMNVIGPAKSFPAALPNGSTQLESYVPVDYLGGTYYVSALDVQLQQSQGTATGSFTNTSLAGLEASQR